MEPRAAAEAVALAPNPNVALEVEKDDCDVVVSVAPSSEVECVECVWWGILSFVWGLMRW